MIKLWLIRHGKTEGNKLARYIGTTDEPLCQEGIEFLKKMDYPKVQEIYGLTLLLPSDRMFYLYNFQY